MRTKVRRRHDAHMRAQSVCAEHREWFDGTPGGQKARAALGTHVADVDRLHALQDRLMEDGRAATEQCRQCRRTLRAAARAIVMVGRIVNLDDPIMDTLPVPGHMSDDKLLAYVRELLERVSPHADAFVAEGLPPGVLQQLGDGITALEAAREARSTSRRRFTAASESIGETLDYADKTVDVLEAILITTPAAPPEVLAKLSIARRVGPRVSLPEPTAPQVTPADKAA